MDEVERLAELNGYPESSRFFCYKEGFIDGYNESQETHPFSEEDMKSFLKFSIEYRMYNDLEGLSKKAEELLQLWESQKIKTIYR